MPSFWLLEKRLKKIEFFLISRKYRENRVSMFKLTENLIYLYLFLINAYKLHSTEFKKNSKLPSLGFNAIQISCNFSQVLNFFSHLQNTHEYHFTYHTSTKLPPRISDRFCVTIIFFYPDIDKIKYYSSG